MARKRASENSLSRKRTNEESPPSSNEPKKRRLLQEKKDNYEQELSKKDKLCWVCHSKDITDDMWYFWPCCPRIYHFDCMSDYPTPETEATCPECQLESVDGTRLLKPVPPIKLKKLLMSVTKKYLDDKKGKKSNDKNKKEKDFKLHPVFAEWPSTAETDLIKVVDFNYLINEIHSDAYSKPSEFFSDVKWILHNCHLLYSSQSAVTKDAGKLVQLIKADLLDIEACYECCYHDSKNSDFVKLCDPPHEIVWSKIGRYPYWAAKCLKVNQETAYVKFFGKHEIGKLSISKCYFMSRNHPNSPSGVPKTKSYNNSMNELRNYIKIYELQRREPFIYYQDKTLFKPENATKEFQETHQSSMSETPSYQEYSSDDLRLGADFSNLNHSSLSEDQMSSLDRPIIVDNTHTVPSSNSPSIVKNIESPIIINQYNKPHVQEISGNRSNQLVSTGNSVLNQINAITRFFGSSQAQLTQEQLNKVIRVTSVFLKEINRLRYPTPREISLNRQIEELQNQILKHRTEFSAEKKELAEKIRREYQSEIMELQDKLQNTQMILRSMAVHTSLEMKNKEEEYKKILYEKEILLEEYKEKLKNEEALNNSLKNKLEDDNIINAKRNSHCYKCLKPSTILCCLNASYCSKICQTLDDERHRISCLKVSQEEIINAIEYRVFQEVKTTSVSNL